MAWLGEGEDIEVLEERVSILLSMFDYTFKKLLA